MSYNKCREIEVFVQSELKLKPGTKSYDDLKGLYQSIVFNETESQRVLSPAQQKKQVAKLHKHLEKIMTKVVKEKPTLRSEADDVKSIGHHQSGSGGILYVYDWLRQNSGVALVSGQADI